MAVAKYLKIVSGVPKEAEGTDELTFAATGGVQFATVTDDAGELDNLVIPKIAGTPTATPTNGEGSMVFDSTNNLLYIWDGSIWNNAFSSASSAQSVRNTYTAGAGGIAARDFVYVSAADTVLKADASAESTARVIGCAQAAITAAASGLIQSEGLITGFTGLTAGARQYLSETAGEMTETPPTAANAVVFQVGFAKSTTVLHMQLQYITTRS